MNDAKAAERPLESDIKDVIREVPDFPEEGVNFKDITPLLNDHQLFHATIQHFETRYRKLDVDYIVAIESRGFIIGSPLAYELDKGLVLVRKPGKLPRETIGIDYALEYGTDRVEMHADSIESGARVAVVDDILATGGTASATAELVERAGGEVVDCGFWLELAFLDGRAKLTDYSVESLAIYH
jgi:adenine phosphoribosyltransferase